MCPSPEARVRFRRTLSWAVVAPPLAALTLAGVFLWQIARLLDQELWVRHTADVIALANQTEKLLLLMQASVRGHLLSGEPHFLDRYRKADAEVGPAAQALVHIVADNPEQVVRAKSIASLVERSRGVSSELVGMRHSGGDYEIYVGNPEYRSLLDDRDRVFAEFIGIEEGLRAQRSTRAQRTAWTVIAVSLGVTAIAGVLMAVAARRTLVGLSSSYQNALESVEQARDELERRVEERTTQLRDVVGQLEAFNYTVSHDLRAPLRAMQGFSQALVEDYSEGLDPKARMYVRRVAAAAERMDGMIQDLLDYSRLSRTDLPLGPVDLDAVVAEATEQAAPDVQSHHIDLQVAGPFPPVVGHGPTVLRVVTNLLSNALKFTRNSRLPTVRIFATEAIGRVRLWVEDNGIGIAPEHQARIFNVFERLHGSEEYPGTGIGLAIVRLAAERMGGSCGVESESGKGSRFWLDLPKAGSQTTAAAKGNDQ